MSIDDPTVEDTNELVRHYLEAAYRCIDGDTAGGASALSEYVDYVDPEEGFARLWAIACVAPVLTATAVKRLADDGQDGFWHVEADVDDMPTDVRAAVQSTSYALNDDTEAVADIVAAHYRAAGGPTRPENSTTALMRLVVEHLHLIAPMIEAGALTPESS
ncbi:MULTISPECIES: hypothetical protein [Prauserella salsuginis group]|uniref:Uncharacterized protein n=2 Tax=Prauserella salsuginis group TaxID=2893672 RepID=A0A839XW40_9PSEU|nr:MULTISPECIES: hypothetical protein [Prauserella salsuginis group]MBB3666369.1 hypothetical protein [Prauserella sediminis]MCR3719158.1 hypothetical protein [Prauserella flava]MCR3735829.1 hypothetical protein [Prauserella salsuginis]